MEYANFRDVKLKPATKEWKFHTGGFKQPKMASGKAWLFRKVRKLKREMAGGIGDMLGIDVKMEVCMDLACKPFDPVDTGALIIQAAVLSACASAMAPKKCPVTPILSP
jgi:hypothetical protein